MTTGGHGIECYGSSAMEEEIILTLLVGRYADYAIGRRGNQVLLT